MAAGEQYARLVINFASIVLISRLLTPTEIGISVIGTGIMVIALGLREFVTADFLIQRRQVTPDDLRTAFTLGFLITVLIALAMLALAPWLGALYGEPSLTRFVWIVAVAGLVDTVSLPVRAALRRDMAFGSLAVVNSANAATTAAATILLALAGFSHMSVAWATLAAAVVTTAVSFAFRPDLSILRPTLGSSRAVLAFGAYNGASFVINRAYETLPQLILGQVLPPAAVGLYNRAQMVSDIPDRLILTSVISVAFPAFAAETRDGRSLKEPYLRALGLITGVYWPALLLLALLAQPLVALILGPQWRSVTPLLQLMAIAGLAWFPVLLTSSVLLAVGANRDRVLADLLGRSLSAAVLCSAAWLGVLAMAASKLVTLPFQMVVALHFARRHIDFRWSELALALWRSAIVTAASAAAALCVVLPLGQGLDPSLATAALAGLAALAGWLLAALATRHPLTLELAQMGRLARAAVIRPMLPAARVGPGGG
jgi:O-antigen/teichoic acid export membrane protein